MTSHPYPACGAPADPADGCTGCHRPPDPEAAEVTDGDTRAEALALVPVHRSVARVAAHGPTASMGSR